MRVLYLTNAPSPYRVEFFEELGKFCDLDVCFELAPSEVRHRDISWYKNTFNNFTPHTLKKVKIGGNYVCPGIINFLKNKYDVIVVGVYSTPTAILAIEYLHRHNMKFFINSDGGFINFSESKIFLKIKKNIIKKADAFLASSEKTGEYLRYYGGVKPTYIYPFSTYHRNELPQNMIQGKEKIRLKEKLGLKEDFIFLSVGQFIFRKGYDILLRSCKQLDASCGIYIVGGEPTQEYIKLKNELKLYNIHFVGFKEKMNLIEFYKASDAFVLPTREDIWGLVINEALSYGLPVITTDRCLAGMELVNNGFNGFIVEAENETELRSKIDYMILNRDQVIKMSINAFEQMRSFTIEDEVEAHLNAFELERLNL